MPNIDLHLVPELKGLTIITNQNELENFLNKLSKNSNPQDSKKLELMSELEYWLKLQQQGLTTFFAVYDEEDNFAKNDGWGHYELSRCIIVKTSNQEGEKIHLFKTIIEKFSH